MRTRSPLRASAAAATAALLLAACGQEADRPVTDTGPETQETDVDDADDDDAEVDVAFVEQMIPHHEGAIAMAELVDGRTDRSELHTLADEIIEVQDAEITVLEGMLERLGAGPAASGEDAHDESHGAMGMASDEQMSALEAADGDAFDRRFLELMIEHHQGAIEMAEQVLADGRDPEVAGLAEAVIAAQQAEIEQMRDWRREWDLA